MLVFVFYVISLPVYPSELWDPRISVRIPICFLRMFLTFVNFVDKWLTKLFPFRNENLTFNLLTQFPW